jgi:hypothetical protein
MLLCRLNFRLTYHARTDEQVKFSARDADWEGQFPDVDAADRAAAAKGAAVHAQSRGPLGWVWFVCCRAALRGGSKLGFGPW